MKVIKNFFKKIIPGLGGAGAESQAKVITRSDHPISRKAIPKNALNVLYRLHNSGYEAFLVGGCVRDLLLGLRPKDFDVATNAKPEQVKRLFSNCRLIGRRFRLAHVYYGHDVIEVATFRAGSTRKSAKHQTSESGMVLRDNVFGTVDEDALRRDFTINALYYRISDFAILDFCEAMQDLQDRTLRLIGHPEQRYREDPVRMLRAARFAAKLNFTLHPDTQAPIPDLAYLLSEVPTARVFEECLKLFLTGHGEPSLKTLKALGLIEQLIPDTEHYSQTDWSLLFEGLKQTDKRIDSKETTAPGYVFAVILWPMYTRYRESFDNKHEAMDEVFRDLNQTISVPKRISLMTTAIWELQDRLENVRQHQVNRLLHHPNFRAAFDFLVLRSRSHSPESQHSAQWWSTIQKASGEAFNELCAELPKQPKRRTRRRSRKKHETG